MTDWHINIEFKGCTVTCVHTLSILYWKSHIQSENYPLHLEIIKILSPREQVCMCYDKLKRLHLCVCTIISNDMLGAAHPCGLRLERMGLQWRPHYSAAWRSVSATLPNVAVLSCEVLMTGQLPFFYPQRKFCRSVILFLSRSFCCSCINKAYSEGFQSFHFC